MSQNPNMPNTLAENSVPYESADKVAPSDVKRKKFATQMNPDLIDQLKAHAKAEGRQIQAVLEDAVRAHLEKQQGYKMRSDVKAALENTLKRYPETLQALAK